jgi:hypothetical protein
MLDNTNFLVKHVMWWSKLKYLSLLSPHHTSSHLTAPHHTAPHQSPHHTSTQIAPRSRQITAPHHTSLHLTTPHLISPHINTDCTSLQITTPHLMMITLPYLTGLPHLTSPHLTSPHLTSPHLCLTIPHPVVPKLLWICTRVKLEVINNKTTWVRVKSTGSKTYLSKK